MGYMGLNAIGDSDMASDFVSGVMDKIAEECEKEIKNKANEYNTPGYVNITLFAEAYLMKESLYGDSRLIKVLKKVLAKLEAKLAKMNKEEDWDNRPGHGKKMHVKAYNRMISNLKKIIDQAY